MSRWHAMLEYFQFPLKVLFFATILLGIGSSIINPNVNYLWEVDNSTVIMISELMRYCGGFLIQMFPLFVFIKLLTRKFEDSAPVFIGFVCYLIINVVILFLEDTSAAPYFYGNLMGIQMSFNADNLFGEVTRIPYNTGIIPLVLAYFITTRCYVKSRHFSMHGILSFIDHDSWAMILSVMLCVFSGVVIAYGWPYVINIINYLYEYISRDLLNPMNLFIYGIVERFSAMIGMGDLPRQAFWFSELGGSATDSFGVLYSGDVNIWYAMQNLNVATTSAGHLITPYYIINIFMIPSFLLGYLSLVSNKKDRQRYFMFFFIAVGISVICGNALPIEIFMIILSPMLYVLYIIMIGLLYAIFQILNIGIGYTLSGSIMVANPGSLLDLFPFFRNPDMIPSLISIMIVGVICFIILFFATRAYFKKYAIGLFAFNDRAEVTQRIINSLGGIDNLTTVDSTPDKLMIGVLHRNVIDFDELQKEGAYLILESKDGYLLRLGNISSIIANEIKKNM